MSAHLSACLPVCLFARARNKAKKQMQALKRGAKAVGALQIAAKKSKVVSSPVSWVSLSYDRSSSRARARALSHAHGGIQARTRARTHAHTHTLSLSHTRALTHSCAFSLSLTSTLSLSFPSSPQPP